MDPVSCEQEANIPISELDYDDQNHGADVSVMGSTAGGPSLLIESLNTCAPAPSTSIVSAAIINIFRCDFPAELGLTREETIKLEISSIVIL